MHVHLLNGLPMKLLKEELKQLFSKLTDWKILLLPSTEDKAFDRFCFPNTWIQCCPDYAEVYCRFSSGLCKDVFLLNTRAGMKLSKYLCRESVVLHFFFPHLFLWLKGYRCIGFRPVDLPSNWIPLHPGLKKKVIESIFIRCERIVRKFANKIFSGRKSLQGIIQPPVDLLLSPIALGYYAGRKILPFKNIYCQL